MKTNPLKAVQDKAQQTLTGLESSEPALSKRNICVRFYLTQEEELQLDQLCDGVCNRSRWIRAKVMGHSLPLSKIPAVNRDLYVQARLIRGNLAQMATAIDEALQQKKPLPLSEEFLTRLQQMQARQINIERELVKLNQLAARGTATGEAGER